MKTATQSIKGLLLIVISLGLATVIVGCDSGKSSSRNRLDPRIYNPQIMGQNGIRQRNCANCGYNNVLTEGIGVVNDTVLDMEIGLSFYSTGAYGSTPYSNDYSYGGSFDGGIQAQGMMTVFSDRSVSCPLPPGDYAVNTIDSGFISGYGWDSGLTLIAQNYQYNDVVIIQMSGGVTDMRDAYGQQMGPYMAADGYPYYDGLQGYLSMQVEGPWGTCFAGGGTQFYMSPPSTAVF